MWHAILMSRGTVGILVPGLELLEVWYQEHYAGSGSDGFMNYRSDHNYFQGKIKDLTVALSSQTTRSYGPRKMAKG
jgi:hypothetical protein